ncbi:MAG: 3-deoxy-D-manno-octulosonic acid transferase [Tannerella sp.]|jgi:3-deoxy-D-manno-octulosonic-acid transferase|nr:3-deoxy-D-manno-octulosonic acid transferase [Tannerella sp.]
MRLLYTFALHLYSFSVEIASFFVRKARLTRLGQWHTNGILREKIDRNARYVWFHAASLGEFEQGRPLMEMLRRRYPQYKILLTFFSPSGYEVRKNYDGADVICYLPFDTPYKVRKFLHLANPVMAVFIKYEFWLNYLSELKRRGIPTYLVSAVFRREQLFFKNYGQWYRRALFCFDRLFVQDKASAQLLAEYGITNVSICGDTRFDRVLAVQRQAQLLPAVKAFAGDGRQPLLVAGSTWPQDEELLFSYFNAHPEVKLIIAPHEIHREHLVDIESRLRRPSVRLSETNDQSVTDKDCLIIDSFGLLSSIYRYGQIAYIGGGFGKGIHNTLEAAVYGIPVIFGPKYQKFREAKELIAAGGGFSVPDEAAFVERMNDLVAHPESRRQTGCIADSYVKQNSGVTECILLEMPLLS